MRPPLAAKLARLAAVGLLVLLGSREAQIGSLPVWVVAGICAVHDRGPVYPRQGSLGTGPGSPAQSAAPSPVSWPQPESLALLEPLA